MMLNSQLQALNSSLVRLTLLRNKNLQLLLVLSVLRITKKTNKQIKKKKIKKKIRGKLQHEINLSGQK